MLTSSRLRSLSQTRRRPTERRRPTQRTLSRTVVPIKPELIIHKIGKVTKFKLRTGRMLITYKAEDQKNLQKVMQHIPASSVALRRHDQRGDQQEGHQEEDQEVTSLISFASAYLQSRCDSNSDLIGQKCLVLAYYQIPVKSPFCYVN